MNNSFQAEKTLTTLAIVLAMLISSCISRLARPAISGVIVDENQKPIEGCKVGETVTAADGSFHLKEVRYNKFFIPEMFMLEAPPVMVMEIIEKKGYEKDTINIFQTFGGGQKKGAKMNVGIIQLKRE